MREDSRDTPWIIVAGSVHRSGGMDKANLALVEYLANRPTPVHLVTHHVDAVIHSHPMVTVHLVRRPLNAFALGSPLLDFTARFLKRKLEKNHRRVRVVANGGNCGVGAVNWSHCVHHAWETGISEAPPWFVLKKAIFRAIELRREKNAYRRAHLIITNSDMTKRDIERCLGEERSGIHRVYLGSDSRFTPVTLEERSAARRAFGIDENRRVAAFIGTLGYENHKGFDTLFRAWTALCADPSWDVDLLAAGEGRSLSRWRDRAAARGLDQRIKLLGFRHDIPSLLAAADILVSPVRYDAYGLSVQEALCRGLPAITSIKAGISERFPPELTPLIIQNPESVEECMNRLKLWRSSPQQWQERAQRFGTVLAERDWRTMAAEMVELIEETKG